MKNRIKERLANLRRIMERENIEAFYVSGTDPHMSEYLCDRWQTRRFFSGFTGSYGEVVVTHETAGLWTDTRYFIQAEEQLAGTGINLHKLRVPEAVTVVQWLKLNLKNGARIGVDPFSLPVSTYRWFSDELSKINVEIVFLPRLIDEVWQDRPPMPRTPVFEIEESVTGEGRTDKIGRILAETAASNASGTLITALDDLAWTLNLRGSDIPYNPVFYGFGYFSKQTKAVFIDEESLPIHIRKRLEDEGIYVQDYNKVYNFLDNLSGETLFLDPSTTNSAVWEAIKSRNQIAEGTAIPTRLKAIKNDTELDGFREAMVQDGVAMVEFLYWLTANVGKIRITEYEAGRKLAFFRSKQPGFRGESFAPIVGYGDHGAIVHLTVDKDNANVINPEGILLFDSGGQYNTGTTDITRTVAVGPVTHQQKRDFTLVLKGMIRLSMAVFPAGTKGMHLDILARQALWENGLNYGHGTGHGVGHFLNVHEGPASIRQEVNLNDIQPGMVFSNEPALYRPGLYGIRTENMMVCAEKETTPFGRFLCFETLTLCPIDLNLIENGLLLNYERDWINNYHNVVREKLLPRLDSHLVDFLISITNPLPD